MLLAPLGPYDPHSDMILEVSATCTHADWSLWQKPVSVFQEQPLGFWTRKFLDAAAWYTQFVRQLLAFYWALTEAGSMTEGHKII